MIRNHLLDILLKIIFNSNVFFSAEEMVGSNDWSGMMGINSCNKFWHKSNAEEVTK